MSLYCKNCGCEYVYVNPDDPGDCWDCQEPLEVSEVAPGAEADDDTPAAPDARR